MYLFNVAQTSKFAVPRVSKPAGRNFAEPTWKSAIRQVWQPAPRTLTGLDRVKAGQDWSDQVNVSQGWSNQSLFIFLARQRPKMRLKLFSIQNIRLK